jgi:IclR family transcriptional regulator, KDG regulon repressor
VTNSLERALALLELLEQTPGGLRNAEISRELKIPRSTCSYIAARLEQKGYLRREPDTLRYQIGLKTVALAHGALRELGFRTVAEPVLYRLASDTGMSAGIGVLQQGRVLLVDRVEGPEFVREVVRRRIARGRTREQRDIGRELGLHTTALGKVLLAYLPERQRAELLRDLVLTRRTPKTIVSKAKLAAELAVVRQQGYATAEEEEYAGVRSLGAPIYDAAREVRAAVSLNGNLNGLAWRDPQALVELIQEAAAEISGNV